MRIQRLLALFFAVVLLLGLAAALSAASSGSVHVQAVDSIGMTVDNMDRAVDFYTRVLTFEKVSDTEVAGREYELLEGVFGARARIVRLRLGDETIELTEYLAPKGRPMPADVRANDRVFQHAAIIVSDMAAAYQRLKQFKVEHASTGPQRLPDWNPNAGGISAFYFRDPDRHSWKSCSSPPTRGSRDGIAPIGCSSGSITPRSSSATPTSRCGSITTRSG